MLKTLRLAPLAALFAAAALVAGCGGDSVPSDAVAKVGDTEISKKDFDHWFVAMAKQQAQQTGQKPADVVVPDPPKFDKCEAAKAKQKLPPGAAKPSAKEIEKLCKDEYEGLREQTMQFLISSQWLIQESEKRKIKVTDEEVDTAFQQQKKQSFPKESDYQKFLETSGQTTEDLTFRVRLSVLTTKLQQDIVESEGKVSDKQIADYYEKNKERFAQPETRDLLVVLNPNKAKAQQAFDALESGQDWKSVSKKFSTDDASKSQGGKLPNVTKGQQEKDFDAAIFKAQKGDVQGPVKTQFGYYVFEVTKIKPAKQQPLEEVEDTIRNLLTSQNQQEALNDFIKDFQKRYTDMTVCADDYETDQCKNNPKESDTQPLTGAPPGSGGTPPGVPPGAQQVPPGAQQVPPGAQQVPPGAQQVPPQGAPPQGGAPPQQVPPQGAPPQGAPPATP
jgi:foldase protein PrsA